LIARSRRSTSDLELRQSLQELPSSWASASALLRISLPIVLVGSQKSSMKPQLRNPLDSGQSDLQWSMQVKPMLQRCSELATLDSFSELPSSVRKGFRYWSEHFDRTKKHLLAWSQLPRMHFDQTLNSVESSMQALLNQMVKAALMNSNQRHFEQEWLTYRHSVQREHLVQAYL
jgi:hypothetical protein